MNDLTTETLNDTLQKKQAVLLYFSSKNCGVCQAIKPKLFDALKVELPLMLTLEIASEEYPDICSSYSVFSMPTAIVFFEGKEFYRVSRNFSIEQFVTQIKRPYTLLTS